jgi:hypothetical protein
MVLSIIEKAILVDEADMLEKITKELYDVLTYWVSGPIEVKELKSIIDFPERMANLVPRARGYGGGLYLEDIRELSDIVINSAVKASDLSYEALEKLLSILVAKRDKEKAHWKQENEARVKEMESTILAYEDNS